MVHLDKIVGNVLPGAYLKTNGIVCDYSFLYPRCEAVFAISSPLIPPAAAPAAGAAVER